MMDLGERYLSPMQAIQGIALLAHAFATHWLIPG
jgi:hypothetical protein